MHTENVLYSVSVGSCQHAAAVGCLSMLWRHGGRLTTSRGTCMHTIQVCCTVCQQGRVSMLLLLSA
jgi:hypothetical protein